jgi:hypothetical protein
MSLVNPISINFPPEMDNSTKFTRSIAVNLVANVSSVLAPVNESRTGAVLRNPGAFDVYLCLADVATVDSAIAVLQPNGFYELAPSDYNGAISVICPAGSSSIAGSEMSSTAFASTVANEPPVPGTSYKVRLNRVSNFLERSLDSENNWSPVRTDQMISAAKMGVDGRLDVLLRDGTTYLFTDIMGAAWSGSSEAYFNSLTVETGAEIL